MKITAKEQIEVFWVDSNLVTNSKKEKPLKLIIGIGTQKEQGGNKQMWFKLISGTPSFHLTTQRTSSLFQEFARKSLICDFQDILFDPHSTGLSDGVLDNDS